jgi:hypothetical protein
MRGIRALFILLRQNILQLATGMISLRQRLRLDTMAGVGSLQLEERRRLASAQSRFDTLLLGAE